jgi:DNA-binding CsgD family transcriptional regulator
LEGLQITKEKVESLSSQIERLKWRRSKVLELSSQGHSQPEISMILQVSLGTVNNDLSYLRQQAQENIQKHIQERLPEEYQRCLTRINQVLKLSWQIANGSKNSNNNDNNGNNNTTMTITADDKTRLQALSLINDCYKYIMDLTTNGVVITDAIRFVQIVRRS